MARFLKLYSKSEGKQFTLTTICRSCYVGYCSCSARIAQLVLSLDYEVRVPGLNSEIRDPNSIPERAPCASFAGGEVSEKIWFMTTGE